MPPSAGNGRTRGFSPEDIVIRFDCRDLCSAPRQSANSPERVFHGGDVRSSFCGSRRGVQPRPVRTLGRCRECPRRRRGRIERRDMVAWPWVQFQKTPSGGPPHVPALQISSAVGYSLEAAALRPEPRTRPWSRWPRFYPCRIEAGYCPVHVRCCASLVRDLATLAPQVCASKARSIWSG